MPRYQRRSQRELQRACVWAVKKLHLQHWDIELFVDRVDGDESLAKAQKAGISGQNHYWPNTLVSHIGVFTSNCKSENLDPLNTLFHEVSHLVADPAGLPNDGGLAESAIELLTSRISWLLGELWEKR